MHYITQSNITLSKLDQGFFKCPTATASLTFPRRFFKSEVKPQFTAHNTHHSMFTKK